MKDMTDATTCIASTALCDKYATEYWHRVMLLLWLLSGSAHREVYLGLQLLTGKKLWTA